MRRMNDEMCAIMEDLRKESIEFGMEKGEETALLRTLKNLLRNNPAMSAEQAMNMMGIPSEEQGKYLKLMK
jgi:hypothetical protein